MNITRKRRTNRELDAWRGHLLAITREIKPATVRQVYYQCVVRGLVEKTETEYKRVAYTLAELRKDGAMPFDWLADATRWQRLPRSHDSLSDMLIQSARLYRRNALNRADRYIEVWLEKDALAGVVYESSAHFDVPLMVARGFASLSFLHSAAEVIRQEGRPTTIYHFADYDPSGQQAARSTRDSLFKLSGREDMAFVQLAVLPAQIEAWNLPTRPTKREGNSHAKHFVGDSVELDAIHPKALRGLVADAIHKHLPAGELQALRAAEASERQALQMFGREISRYGETGIAEILGDFAGRMAADDF